MKIQAIKEKIFPSITSKIVGPDAPDESRT